MNFSFLNLFLEVSIQSNSSSIRLQFIIVGVTLSCGLLHLFGHVGYDGFGPGLENEFPLDESSHRVRCGAGSLLLCFHGDLRSIIIVMAAHSVLEIPWVLEEDSKRLLQFDLLAIQDMVAYNEHWHPLFSVEQISHHVPCQARVVTGHHLTLQFHQ